MFLRRIPQSFRIARLSSTSPLKLGISRPSTRSVFTSLLHPGHLSLAHNVPATSRYSGAASITDETSHHFHQTQDEGTTSGTVVPELTSIQDLEAALHVAYARERFDAVDSIVAKLVDLYRSESAVRLTLFHALLGRQDLNLLSNDTVLTVLQLLRSSPYEANCLDPQTIYSVILQKIDSEPIRSVLADIVKMQLQELQIPTGVAALQYSPPSSVSTVFRILQTLIVKDTPKAWDIFNVLVDTGFVPADALEDSSLIKSNDVKLVMFYGLAMASLHWEWTSLATESITNLLRTKSAHHPLLPQLINDVVTSLLDDQTAAASSKTLQAFVDILRTHRVPDNAVRRFYEVARTVKCAKEAVDLYRFTRSEAVAGQHPYPPPRGHALGWLMECLSEAEEYSLVGTLAQEVLHDHLTIYLAYRPSFLRAVIASGDLKAARELWKKWATGDDGYVIVGDTRVALALIKKVEQYLTSRRSELADKLAGRKKHTDQTNAMKQDIVDWERFQRRVVARLEDHLQSQKGKHLSHASTGVLGHYVEALFIVRLFDRGIHYMKILIQRNGPSVDRYMSTLTQTIVRSDRKVAQELVNDYEHSGNPLEASIRLGLKIALHELDDGKQQPRS